MELHWLMIPVVVLLAVLVHDWFYLKVSQADTRSRVYWQQF